MQEILAWEGLFSPTWEYVVIFFLAQFVIFAIKVVNQVKQENERLEAIRTNEKLKRYVEDLELTTLSLYVGDIVLFTHSFVMIKNGIKDDDLRMKALHAIYSGEFFK